MVEPIIYVVEDDSAVRDSLYWLLKAAELETRVSSTLAEFAASYEADRPGCLILDLQLPDGNGIKFLSEFSGHYPSLPVIFITAFGDVATAVRAMRSGAIDFLEKPFDEKVLLDRVREALQIRRSESEAKGRVSRLTGREREILDLIVEGYSTKKIAAYLERSEKTVEGHRHNIMRKLEAGSLAQMVRIGTLASL